MVELSVKRGAVREVGRLARWLPYYGTRGYRDFRRTGSKQQVAVNLRDFLLRMGPMYTKAGQILGTQTGLFDADAIAEFRDLFADMPAMPAWESEQVLHDKAHPDLLTRLTSFEPVALAAGTVAQVHQGRLDTGEKVALKIVKTGVRERLAASTAATSAMLTTLQKLVPAARSYDALSHFAELRPFLVDQCDMRLEAQRQEQVGQNFAAHPFVRVPRVYPQLCSEDVLVMEFIDAVPGTEFATCEFPKGELARRMQDTFYTMAFFHGLFHVDPHPGNMMLTHDGEIIMLDYGLVGTLSEDGKWALASFYYGCIQKQWDRAVDRFIEAFTVAPESGSTFPARKRQDLIGVLRYHFEEKAEAWSTMGFFDDATKVLRAAGWRLTTDFTLLGLAFLTGEGLVSAVDPEIDIWSNARRFTDRFSPFMSEDLKELFDTRIAGHMPKSMAIKNDADRALIAQTHMDRYVLPSEYPLIVESAEGATITDIDGNTYIDLASGFGPHILGYRPKVVVEAVTAAMEKGAVNAIGNTAEVDLAQLISAAFGGDKGVVFTNSGTESVLTASRIARAATRKDRIAKFEGHYHGWSDQGMVSSWFRYSGTATEPQPISNSAGAQRQVVENTLVLQYGSPISIERIRRNADSLAAVLIEPMPSMAVDYDIEFLQALRQVCDECGVMLIFDEVVSGFRVTYGGVQTLTGVEPDLTCLGKIVGGGLPGGAVVGHPRAIWSARTTNDPFEDWATRAFCGGTTSGNSVSSAAGAAVLRHLRDNPAIYTELDARTDYLRNGLQEVAEREGVPARVSGKHTLFSIGFDYSKPALPRDQTAGSHVKATLALAYYMRLNNVYLPELHTILLNNAHTYSDLDTVVDAFGTSIGEMKRHNFFVY
ncbi:aminotransferase class III-fold pyridoxal phosphate-dependent enzyme [Nocardia cyriacigeorgica]|uniref:aminotransferase class III-fold pyridoxal phosphate-dependent enzyme n=1 Tax=Nocardia cyriacigeorgica TaxID=135487 RepID=UPI001893CF8A|nr:aminotransferase class III-fold pyridoxal phosphate-dependent enzyme [Nocardia cyriacigeorgica]MBF6439994.1 aminotransferase class III-fold pyridoxal phosphate-dependent enzyme [Nocardia cyriacigeorgica]